MSLLKTKKLKTILSLLDGMVRRLDGFAELEKNLQFSRSSGDNSENASSTTEEAEIS